jgi:CheY-like chemotaxis protein
MPEMNGFEATGFIRNTLKSDIPIIALTADVTSVDLAKCKAVGMNDYIAKPVDEKVLFSKIVMLVKKTLAKETNLNVQIEDIKNRYTNLDYLNTRTKSNPALMMEMISLYLKQTPQLILEMKQGYKDKDWNTLYTAVHKMIPSFSIMGISGDFEKMAHKVQDYAKNQQQSAGIHEMIQQLEKVFMQSCEELKNELITIKNTNK